MTSTRSGDPGAMRARAPPWPRPRGGRRARPSTRGSRRGSRRGAPRSRRRRRRRARRSASRTSRRRSPAARATRLPSRRRTPLPASASTFVRWSQNSLPSAATAALSPVATEWSRRFQIGDVPVGAEEPGPRAAPTLHRHSATASTPCCSRTARRACGGRRRARRGSAATGRAHRRRRRATRRAPRRCLALAPERIGDTEIRRDGERLGVDDAEAAFEQHHLGRDHPAVHASDPVAKRQQRAYHPCGRHAGVAHRVTVYPRRSTIIAMP